MPEPTRTSGKPRMVAIACGGTGGHLFPGMAVAQELVKRGCQVTLLISPKKVDQDAVKNFTGAQILTLPAVGLTRGNIPGFVWGFLKSYRQAGQYFQKYPPQQILGMGGFTSAPPILAARKRRATALLHESNTVPGRANRFLARFVDGAFVYFEQTAALLRVAQIESVGMPVRREFLEAIEQTAARTTLGLKPKEPVLLIMGGSQGASKINELALACLSRLRDALPTLQFIHLTGTRDAEPTRAAYAAQKCPALVRSFMDGMGRVLAAADVAVSRAGASSLAELAARQLPSVLIPYPYAAGNHQFQNARIFSQSGAARMITQQSATPELLSREILELITGIGARHAMRRALAGWHKQDAAAIIAERILSWPERPAPQPASARLDSRKMEALNV